MRTEYMMTAEDVANVLGISKGHAYKIVKSLNEQLKREGFIVVSGRIPKAYWNEKFYYKPSGEVVENVSK